MGERACVGLPSQDDVMDIKEAKETAMAA